MGGAQLVSSDIADTVGPRLGSHRAEWRSTTPCFSLYDITDESAPTAAMPTSHIEDMVPGNTYI